ncbi:MAG: hypothetical protein ACR2K3_00880 [Nocardioides sp.]
MSPLLTGTSLTVTRAALDQARASGPAQADRQRTYANQDRSIEPERQRLPSTR